MTLTKQDIERFQMLYKNRFGAVLTVENAETQGLHLLNLMSIVYKPVRVEDYKNFNENKYENTKSTNNN